MSSDVDRFSLRQHLRLQRQQLSLEERCSASQTICQFIKDAYLIKPKQQIAVYIAQADEVDLSSLIQDSLAIGADVYVPVIPATGRQLCFFSLSSPGQWQQGPFGIDEWISQRQIAPQALTYVFVPLLGFDEQGNRLGQGGGYYDATFAFTTQQPSQSPYLIGVAFNCQKSAVPIDPWGVPLHGVITEKCYYGNSLPTA